MGWERVERAPGSATNSKCGNFPWAHDPSAKRVPGDHMSGMTTFTERVSWTSMSLRGIAAV